MTIWVNVTIIRGDRISNTLPDVGLKWPFMSIRQAPHINENYYYLSFDYFAK